MVICSETLPFRQGGMLWSPAQHSHIHHTGRLPRRLPTLTPVPVRRQSHSDISVATVARILRTARPGAPSGLLYATAALITPEGIDSAHILQPVSPGSVPPHGLGIQARFSSKPSAVLRLSHALTLTLPIAPCRGCLRTSYIHWFHSPIY